MTSKLFLGLVAGAAVGVTAGVLLAPNKGRKTRKKLKKEASTIKEDLKKEVSEVADTVEGIYSSQKDVVNEKLDVLVNKASHAADDVLTKLEIALRHLKSKNKKYHNGSMA